MIKAKFFFNFLLFFCSFASPLRQQCVDYRRFSDVVEESFVQQSLERAPLIVPLQHLPTKDSEKNFLNFDERIVLADAIRKLSKKPEQENNLMSIFQVSCLLTRFIL